MRWKNFRYRICKQLTHHCGTFCCHFQPPSCPTISVLGVNFLLSIRLCISRECGTNTCAAFGRILKENHFFDDSSLLLVSLGINGDNKSISKLLADFPRGKPLHEIWSGWNTYTVLRFMASSVSKNIFIPICSVFIYSLLLIPTWGGRGARKYRL